MKGKDKTIDLKVISGMLRRIRSERGLSPVAFADELDKPAWLIDLLEHGEEFVAGSLCSLIPPQEIESVLREIEELYGASSEGAVFEASTTPEVTFYLPVTMSAKCAMDMIDQLLLFAADGNALKRQQILQRGIVSAALMVQMINAYYKQTGCETEAEQSLTCFREMLQERMRVCG